MYCLHFFTKHTSGFDVCCVPSPTEDLKKCMLVRKITVGKDLVETPQRGEQANAARDSLSSLEQQLDRVGPSKSHKCWEKISEKHGETVLTPGVPKNLGRLTRIHMPVATGKVFGLESGSMSQKKMVKQGC